MALLEAGAPVNAQGSRGNTPDYVAVRMGRYSISRILFKAGGSRAIQNIKKRNHGKSWLSSSGLPAASPHSVLSKGGQKLTILFSEVEGSQAVSLPQSTYMGEASAPGLGPGS
ncbi:hypothetical protein CCMA1212_010338 [Trichoderma ghanense]|uniref:Uncharacterized protein n=1 Tax=Trichoderma ghanense TaxID=65468 RepID=A0ABY2GRJ9_9HYPO